MNKKQLEIKLSKLERFDNVKPELEQYATDSDSAAVLLWIAFMNGDIENKVIADLGCGNGIFGIGALILGAKKVYFVDVDKDSLEVAEKNCENVEFLNLDVSEFDEKVDVVLMNPPFGVQNVHADKVFLEKAMDISNKIYSIHKIESKEFINSLTKDSGFGVSGVEEINMPLGRTMQFHKKDKHFVKVGIWILKRKV